MSPYTVHPYRDPVTILAATLSFSTVHEEASVVCVETKRWVRSLGSTDRNALPCVRTARTEERSQRAGIGAKHRGS